MPVTIKHTFERRIIIYRNRPPALTVIIIVSFFGKVSFSEYNIRHHFKVGTRMVPDIV